MNEFQERIFKETQKILSPMSIVTILVNAVVSGAIVTLVFYLLKYQLTVFNVSFIAVVSVLYSFLRDALRLRSSKKNLQSHFTYLVGKKPYLSLYVPIFSRVGVRMVLKSAAIFFIEDKLYLEAYKAGKSKSSPDDSITVKLGKDFSIESYQKDEKHPIVSYEAKLMDTEYNFSIVYDEELIQMIESSKGDKE